jgi:adenylyl cyclase-associated protein
LKKVDDSMKTHKNPGLRAGNTVGASSSPKPYAPPKKAAAPATKTVKPPVFELRDEKKWIVENHVDRTDLVINASKEQIVYM